MFPSTADYKRIIDRDHLPHTDVTRQDINAAEDIFGTNINALKGKTVHRSPRKLINVVDDVPAEIMDRHQDITLFIDIMFVNKQAFLITLSESVHLGTLHNLDSRQTSHVGEKLKQVIALYTGRGFRVTVINGDPEFAPLAALDILSEYNFNLSAQGEHVGPIERYIRTVKDRTRSAHNTLRFLRIPAVMIRRLVHNAVFWLNAFPYAKGVSPDYSPRYIVTGHKLDSRSHVRLPFGAYVQTHEDHDSSMKSRTLGAICMGPTGNRQGAHYFMSLETGKQITRYVWTELPMPRDVRDRVAHLGRNMPVNMAFGDRWGRPIWDDGDEIDDEHDSLYNPDDDIPPDDDDAALDNFEPEGPLLEPDPAFPIADPDPDPVIYPDPPPPDAPAGVNIVPSPNALPAQANQPQQNNEEHGGTPGVHHGTPGIHDENTGVHEDAATETPEPVETTGVQADVEDETTGVQADVEDETTGVQADVEDEIAEVPAETEDETTGVPTATHGNEEAETNNADVGDNGPGDEPAPDATGPNLRSRRSPNFEHRSKEHGGSIYEWQQGYNHMNCNIWTEFAKIVDQEHLGLCHMTSSSNHAKKIDMATEQMSMKKGMKFFGQDGAKAVGSEVEQLDYRDCMEPVKKASLTRDQLRQVLNYLMFLKRKQSGRVKARGCADGRKQRIYKTKEETTSPTVMTESVFLTSMLEAHEGRYVVTLDIPGAFMQTEIDELIHIRMVGEMVEQLLNINREKYEPYVAMEKGVKVLYCKLKKALYGTLQAAKLFWQELTGFLKDLGFETNPYDKCVANKIIDGKQCTIIWHVDDLKISHMDKAVVEEIVACINKRFGKEAPVVVHRGHVHEYLGMTIDYSNPGEVWFDMIAYIERILSEVPDELLRGSAAATPAANHLFEVKDHSPRLSLERGEIFHHLTAQLLYLSKRARPDLEPTVPYLCTRVQKPNEDDWKKLGRCLKYLQMTKDLKLKLRVDSDDDGQLYIEWWVDASFAVHPDMKSHTGAIMSLGRGAPITISSRQKLNTTSSTTAELVGVSDAMGMIEWVRLFLEGQGYSIADNVVYQDNESAILLEKNGKASSGKRTRHLNIRFFYITDKVSDGTVRIEKCPTHLMRGDFQTKPLQGGLFRDHRGFMLGEDTVSAAHLTPQECVGDQASLLPDWVEVRRGDKKCARPQDKASCKTQRTDRGTFQSYYDVLMQEHLSSSLSRRLGNEWF